MDRYKNNLEASGRHISKKPKLDIDKHISLSGTLTRPSQTSRSNEDIYADIWGEDFDSSALEELDETLAQSQMTETMKLTNIQSTPGYTVQSISTSQINQSNTTRANFINPGSDRSIPVLAGFTKSSPRVPLRRTASSGWPSGISFSPQSKNLIEESKRIHEKHLFKNDLEQLRLENEKLKEELNRKTGEAQLMRDRLVSIQQENNKQKNEYLERINTIKQEADQNRSHLSKEIKSLKCQLDVKVMEMETAERKTQRCNSTNHLKPMFSPVRAKHKQVQREDHLMYGSSHTRAKKYTLSVELIRKIITPELLKPTQQEASIVESTRPITKPGLFSGQQVLQQAGTSESSLQSKCLDVKRNEKEVLLDVKKQLSASCPALEPCCLSLLSTRLLDISSDNAHQIISQIVETCVQVLVNQLQQLESAASHRNHYLEGEREIQHCAHKNRVQADSCNLLSSKELYNNERGICARRALGLLSVLTETSDVVVVEILPSANTDQLSERGSSNDTHVTLNLIKDIVNQIETQRRTLLFEGVLYGAAVLIKSLLQSQVILTKQSQELITLILRGLVFARPGSVVINNILKVLLAAVNYPDITDDICCNSVKKTFLEQKRHSLITFTTETCTLQVLCMQLQLVETPNKHVLSDTFTLWVLTIFYGNKRDPRWLFAVPSQTLCQCRPLISRLTLTMLGEACCIYPSVSDSSNEKKLLKRMLERGVLLVSTLLYQDEHFGTNVDLASVGNYELFLHCMVTYVENLDIKLNSACCEILDYLCIQEAHRQPMYSSDRKNNQEELDSLLGSLYLSKNSSACQEVLEHLETC